MKKEKDKKIKKGSGLKKIRKTGQRTLGPLANLEEQVHSDWWKVIFNSLYLKTDGDVVDDQKITQSEIDMFLGVLNLPSEASILDLCCGQGRHSMEIARRGYKNVEGMDRSHYLIQRAKGQAKKEKLAIKFREGDARKLPYIPDTFETVMLLGNSFGYFETIQDELRILKEIFRVLKPWGKVLVDIADGEHLRNNFQPRSWEWIDKKHFVCRERSLSGDNERLVTREVITHVEKGVLADQFYAVRLFKQEDIQKLLLEVGFQDIVFHGELVADSQRNQDLGMMEQRILGTAVVRKEWSPIKTRAKKEVKHVVVLMGDPQKTDLIKPGSTFDEDDFHTIDQLKDALQGLQDYRFTYLNNHDTLISDLIKLQGKVDLVFNLCDEGYYNEPLKELHVPSLLEILGFPYTGGTPQCLASCYDKSLVRGISIEMGIPVSEAMFIKPEDSTFQLTFGFPAILKPNFGDSSFGITQEGVVYTPEELMEAVTRIRVQFGYEKPILVEEFLTGKDLTMGVIGNSPQSYQVFPIAEEDYSDLPPHLPRICGYEAKWDPTSPYWKHLKSIQAELPEETEKRIIECSLLLFERMECRDYARFDWRLNSQGEPKLLEVNPNPGWCWDGHLAKVAAMVNITYPEMLNMILQAAEARLSGDTMAQREKNKGSGGSSNGG